MKPFEKDLTGSNPNDPNDKITIELTRKDVNAMMMMMSAGSIGLEGSMNTMKFMVGTPKDVENHIQKITMDGGSVYSRLMVLAKAKWPEGLVPKAKAPVAQEEAAPMAVVPTEEPMADLSSTLPKEDNPPVVSK